MNKQEKHIIIFILFVLVLGLCVQLYRNHVPVTIPISTPPAEELTGLVNINTADINTLQNIPGIGPVIARRIVEYRTLHGRYKNSHDLLNVKGIGPKKLQKMHKHIVIN